ncbi:MAG: hypothetical protein A4S09_03585 [Proteobacteria bacterium SG_bin7]|nr:MAG: hypothetical protein A4S09_03585 [Proteobacteria bacterium SG_bin7]
MGRKKRVRIKKCEALLARNANVHHRNTENSSAMIYAMKSGNFNVVRMLESKGATVVDRSNHVTSLMNAAESGNYYLVKWLVEEKKADVNEQMKNYYAIKSAAITGHSAIIEYLVTHGANQESIDAALVAATVYGHIDAIEATLEGGANVNTQNEEGDTPIMIAAGFHWSYEFQWPEIVRTLILANADLSIKNKEGKTVMDVASYNEKIRGYLKHALEKR